MRLLRVHLPLVGALLAAACAPGSAHDDDAGVASALIATTPGNEAVSAAFAAEHAVGTMLIRRLADRREWLHEPARADSAFLPASTFKIVNAAIGLASGVAASPEENFPWDGVQREFDSWNRDHTLRSGMAASAVPAYQELARRIGEPLMSDWLRRLDYGNADTGGGIDEFWLRGDLRISARQQVDFLERLVTGQTPLPDGVVAAVTDMMRLDHGDGWVLHGKTGWAFEVQLGWIVGWSAHHGEIYVFALNMAMPDSAVDPPRRLRIARAALTAVGALPESEEAR